MNKLTRRTRVALSLVIITGLAIIGLELKTSQTDYICRADIITDTVNDYSQSYIWRKGDYWEWCDFTVLPESEAD